MIVNITPCHFNSQEDYLTLFQIPSSLPGKKEQGEWEQGGKVLKYKHFVKIREQMQNKSNNSRPDPIWYI